MDMKKYRFKYLPKEISEINNILYNNSVTISVEELQSYYKALEEIAPVIHKSYERYLKFLESKKGA